MDPNIAQLLPDELLQTIMFNNGWSEYVPNLFVKIEYTNENR